MIILFNFIIILFLPKPTVTKLFIVWEKGSRRKLSKDEPVQHFILLLIHMQFYVTQWHIPQSNFHSSNIVNN